MPNGRKTYDDYFKDRDKKNGNIQSKPDPTSTMFRRNTSGIVGINTDYGNFVYDENLNWGADINPDDIKGSLNEFRANEQSALDHLGIGLVRTGAKAATEVAKLPGVIGGIAMSPFAEENEGFNTAFNNQWIKFFDSLNEDVKESLPVYMKESIKNGDFFDKIGSSAFYATEGADGAGYMLGALAPGGLFKYFGGAAKLFGVSTKAAKLGMFGKSIEAGRKAMTSAGITIDKIDSYMIPAFNTIAEAGAESKGVWDGMESRKGEAHEEYMSKLNPNDSRFQTAISLKNEQLDQLRRAGEISIDEYNQQSANIHNVVAEEMFEKDFKEQKALAAQNSFFKNVAVLAGPNYIQAKLLFGKTPSKVLLDKIGGLGEKSIKNTFKQGAKNFVKGFASEGAEEIGQTAIEHRNTEQGLNFKLGNSRADDYNPLTFGDDFIKTLGTTEGQIAGFLGGIMGAPMSTVGSYFQDKSDRKQTERLREKINGASTAYADIKNTNIYEQEEYTNPETGEVGFRDKEVDGKKVFIPEAVAKVKKALDLIEKDSNEYDNAVEDGDIEKIEQFRNRGEFNVIANFIGEDEVTLDALHEHLKVAFPTETSKDISDEQVKVNKTNLERIDKIMSKAKHLQKDFVSFKDMSASILRINHPDITKDSTKEEKETANKHLEDFLNRVGNTFLSERAEEYEAKQVLNKLEKQRLELENSSLIIEIDNSNYIEGFSSELDKKTKTRSNNPRLELVNSLIDKVKEQLKGYEENINSNIWNNELLNKQFTEEVKEIDDIKKENTPEQIAKNDEVLNKTKNATTVDEIKEIEKTSPKEALENPIIKKAIADKKAEIIKAEEIANAEEIATASQEDNDFNDTTGYSDLNGTEGSNITDELTPKEAENNTVEELKSIENSEVDSGLGVKVISTDRNTGLPLQFMSEQFPLYLDYEREPVNKSGKEVGFEINQNPGKNPKVLEALDAFNRKDFSNPKLLIDYLPINVQFTNEIKAPIETRRVTDEINPATELLRIEIINHLIKGGSINDIKTTIQDQYKGLLKVDENRFANNNILQLDGVKDLKYVRDNLYVVDSFGNLMNIQSGKTKTFSNGKTKKNAAGEIYLSIPQANGKPFPLKLNIKKISESEAVLLYEIYKEIITNEKSLNTTISETNPELQEAILKSFEPELNIIGGNKNDIKLQEIVDLLIYQSDNIKSRMQIENGVLYYGENEANINNIEESQNAIINFLVDSKRHQIKINPKFATDNTKTNLKSNSADYLKYLVDNNILSTNAVVNEPTFQGHTNIYLNTGITINNQVKSTQKVAEVSPEVADIEKRRRNDIERYDESDKRGIEKINPDAESTKGSSFKVGTKWNDGYKVIINSSTADENYIGSDDPYIVISKIIKPAQFDESGIMTKAPVVDVMLFNNKEEADKFIKERLEKVKLSAGKRQQKANEKYDAELAALNQPKVSESGVEVSSNNFGSLDFGDKKVTTQPITGLSITYTPTGKQSQTYTINKNKIINSKGEEVFKEDSADRRKIFANVAVKEGRAKVIEDNKGVKYVVNNKQQIMSTTTGKIMEWAENHATRKLLLDKYNKSVQPEISDNGVEVTADNTGFDEMFNTAEMGDDVLDILKEFETEPKAENNSNNTRNVQENFLSLSEIKGTVENTELKETQTEVFNENKIPPTATEMRLINKAITVYQEDASKLTESQKKRLEEYATNYPESWKKICK